MQSMDTVLKCLMDINGFTNLIKNKNCFKVQASSMDLFLTNRKWIEIILKIQAYMKLV